MTPAQTLVFELLTHGGLTLMLATLWLLERRWRRAAERRELTEFDLRMDAVLAKSGEVEALHKRIEELEGALRGDPYSRTAPPSPPQSRPYTTHLEGDYRRSVRPNPPSNPTPPQPTLRCDG